MSQDAVSELDIIIKKYPQKQSAILPLLHYFQEREGYVSEETISFIAEQLEIAPMRVHEVFSFYPMFRQKAAGKYHIKLCHTLSCELQSSAAVGEILLKELNCSAYGETSPDGKFTVELCECLANCHKGPNLLLNGKLYEGISLEKVKDFVENLKSL